MSSYTKMDDTARKRLVDIGILKPETKQKPKSYSLVWTYCGKDNTVISNKPYPYCKSIQNKKSKETQYRKGVFKIAPNY